MLPPVPRFICYLLLWLLLGPGTACAAVPSDTGKLLAEAKALQKQYKDSEALAKYEQVLGLAPATYEALWQAAVLSVRIGGRYTDETRKAAYFSAARMYSTRALVVQPNGAEASYADALVLLNMAPLLGARGRLLAYKEMREGVFKATELAPAWADAWQLLGRWHYRVGHYNILERLYSKVALGGMPRSASTRRALIALAKAHELDPTRIQFCYDLARVRLNQGQRSQAIAVLQEAAQLTPLTSEELEVSRRCRTLLEQLNRKMLRQLNHKIRQT